MKKAIKILLVIILAVCVLSACDDVQTHNKSFEIFGEYYVFGTSYSVVYHVESKVMYAVSHDGAFTLLVNADGSPMIYHGEL